jgi:hypothetical protein
LQRARAQHSRSCHICRPTISYSSDTRPLAARLTSHVGLISAMSHLLRDKTRSNASTGAQTSAGRAFGPLSSSGMNTSYSDGLVHLQEQREGTLRILDIGCGDVSPVCVPSRRTHLHANFHPGWASRELGQSCPKHIAVGVSLTGATATMSQAEADRHPSPQRRARRSW